MRATFVCSHAWRAPIIRVYLTLCSPLKYYWNNVLCTLVFAATSFACCRTVKELLGHADVSTTMIYTYVLNKYGKGVLSPLDNL